jgi:TRAP-type C4-dicarboxylate transport system permease small subunit
LEPSPEGLAGLLATSPSLGRFCLAVAPVLLAGAGVAFALRGSGPVLFLRRETDRALGAFVAALLLVMVFLSALQILLRNAFDSGILWIDPLLRHLVLLLAFAGALLATGRKRHVQINVLGRLVKGRAQRAVGAAVAAVSGAICLALAHAGLQLVADEIAYGETLFLGVHSSLVAGVFPVSFLALAWRFSWLFFLELAGEAPPPGEEPPGIEDFAPGGGAGAGERAS